MVVSAMGKTIAQKSELGSVGPGRASLRWLLSELCGHQKANISGRRQKHFRHARLYCLREQHQHCLRQSEEDTGGR